MGHLTIDFAWDADPGGQGVWHGDLCLEAAVWNARGEDVQSGEAGSDTLADYYLADAVLNLPLAEDTAVLTETNEILRGVAAMKYVQERAALCLEN